MDINNVHGVKAFLTTCLWWLSPNRILKRTFGAKLRDTYNALPTRNINRPCTIGTGHVVKRIIEFKRVLGGN